MKLTKNSFANASALTTAFVWLVCSFGVLFFPCPSYMMGRWFTHERVGLTMMQWNMTFPGFLYGGLILVFFAWVTGYVFGWFLEYFGKK
jgi:hypothetical protein